LAEKSGFSFPSGTDTIILISLVVFCVTWIILTKASITQKPLRTLELSVLFSACHPFWSAFSLQHKGEGKIALL
jgi:hypothetical protein